MSENRIINHHEHGIVLFSELKKCPDCPCVFLNSFDFARHRDACRAREDHMGWRKSRDGRSEWCSVDKDPELVRQIRMNGKLVLAGREYSVSTNGKWITRKGASEQEYNVRER